MTDIKAVSLAVTNLLGARATLLERLSIVFKVAAALGAAVIAVAKIANLSLGTVYVAATVVFISTVFVLFADRSSSATIAEARKALDKALEQQSESEAVTRKYTAVEKAYNAELERLSHFQAARDLFRAIFEDVASSTSQMDDISVIELMLRQGRRQLFLAHGFAMNDFYTICVYQVVGEELVCKAHIRAIDCDLKLARTWKEGVGAAGTAWARGEEVVVPDLRDPALGSLYNLLEKKPEDDERYRSIVAEPIGLDGKGSKIWGILVVTSSVPGHFSIKDRSYVNVAQSLAGMISLGVKLVRAKSTPAAQSGG